MDDEQRDQQRGPAASTSPPDPTSGTDEPSRERAATRHAQLLQRDHIVGIEAEIGRQNAQILELHASLRKMTARAKRLNARKRAQAKRIEAMQDKLATARRRNAALARRVAELEANARPPSLARRAVRRLRGPGR